LDALTVETSINLRIIKKNQWLISLGDFISRVPVSDNTLFEEIIHKYEKLMTALSEQLNNDVEQLNDFFNKALNNNVSKADLNVLSYFFGDLQDEVATFIKNASKLSTAQKMELVSKYMGIAFQYCITKILQRLAEKGNVLRDTSLPPTMIRVLWIPQQEGVVSKGVHDIPSSKIQAIALLKSIMPGLIDFSTDENEYTRIARLSLHLADNNDIDTLVDIIIKLYLDPSDAELPRHWEKLGLPKKYVPLMLLNHVLSKKYGVFTVVDFEMNTPIVITYPKLPYTENNNNEQ
jgi:hypothetical protein